MATTIFELLPASTWAVIVGTYSGCWARADFTLLNTAKEFFDVGNVFGLVRLHPNNTVPAVIFTDGNDRFRALGRLDTDYDGSFICS
jgi:hypothetical protein